jgi:cytochrome subunit of sulfide dehydrogenase
MFRPPGVAAVAAAAAVFFTAPAALAQDTHVARNLSATCANCHGTHGLARGEMRPLAGQSADSLVAKLAAYKTGAAPATIMHQIAKGYSDEQLKLIAAWFAAQPPRP